ncbi:MAG TPA: 1-acyl-sn-glycerol-3-phosphate acyltransferase [Bacteroides sp.]|nr:1-acyl-sn-glycerol-3-phosphate acyltransferase [Bacteroides sp.]
MSRGFLKVYSAITWATMVITSVIITPFFLLVWIFTFWWDRRRVAAHFMGTFWAWHYQSLVPFWKLHLEGREKIPWKRPVVLVSNHRSLIDILALYKLRRPFKWTSKAENFKLPFVGMVLSLTRSVRIHRGSARAGLQFLSRAEEEMKKGSSVLIFPEGTRTKTGVMRPFMDGAFVLAKKTGSGIIPIVHTGTENTFDSGSWVLKGRADIFIRVLDEITPEEVKQTELKDLMEKTRQIMERGLAELEREKAVKGRN